MRDLETTPGDSASAATSAGAKVRAHDREGGGGASENGGRVTRRALALGGLGGLGALAAGESATARDRRAGTGREVDVVVVGAGYAGPLIAKILAEAGKRVVVLESGPKRRTKDLVSSQIWSRRLHGPYEVSSVGEHPFAVGFNVGWGLGGSGTHHFGAWPRMHPVDFEMRSRFGRALDWPIGYEDLRSYYDRVEHDFGVSGDAEAEVWRPPGRPYPLPPLDIHTHARTLARGFHALGLRTAPTPMVVLSRPYKGRPGCEFVGWCNAGCAIGALGHPLVTVIPEARRAGVHFRTGAHVLRVLTERGRATGVEYADERGRRHVQRARLVVLAAFSLETPRILLNSGEGGVANSSGLVGHYMHPHVLGSIFGLFPEPTELHRGTVGGQLLNQDMYDPSASGDVFGGFQIFVGAAAKPNDLAGIANTRADLNGAGLDEFMRRAATNMGIMSVMGFSTPQRDNALALVDELDRHGMRKAVVSHTYDADAVRLYQAGTAKGLEIMRAAGAQEAWAGPLNTAHIMGGTIMGSDPRASVANSYGQTHDLENLFLAGAGLFPTAGAVNPTLTLNALALRSAEFITRNWAGLT